MRWRLRCAAARLPVLEARPLVPFRVERVLHHLLDIVEPSQATVDALMKLDLSAGVHVEIKST